MSFNWKDEFLKMSNGKVDSYVTKSKSTFYYVNKKIPEKEEKCQPIKVVSPTEQDVERAKETVNRSKRNIKKRTIEDSSIIPPATRPKTKRTRKEQQLIEDIFDKK